MPYYAVYATSWRRRSYVAFLAALVENGPELAMLCHMWPQFVTPRNDRSLCMTMGHFWSLSCLRGSLIVI